jgi:hypothetical protein
MTQTADAGSAKINRQNAINLKEKQRFPARPFA